MAAKVFFVLSALVCVTLAGRVVREAPKDDDLFKQAIDNAAASFNSIKEHIDKMINPENTKKFEEAIKTHSKNFADTAEEIQKKFDEELKKLTNTTSKQAFEDVNQKIIDAVSGIREHLKNPEAAQKSFKESVNNLVEQGKNLVAKYDPQVTEAGKNLEKLTTNLLNTAVEALASLNEQFQGTPAAPVKEKKSKSKN